MRKNIKMLLLAAVAVTVAVALAACGGDDDSSGGGSGQSEASAPPPGPGNKTDAMFANSMIPHHEGAIEMAEIAQKQGERPEVKQMAGEIIGAQEKEIKTLRPIAAKLSKEFGDEQMEMDMMSESEMADFEKADPFDRAFIDMMTPHHESAVKMAEEELAKGENATLRGIAEDIVSSQNSEIEQMRKWREEWYGSSGDSGGESMPGMGH